ncbi:conjugal transfer protein TraN [Providencia rettgeri]|uniref:Conjugal transfer protein TraN n=1 Tax=Providencia rettgeri TaxID=587 RepID=A0A939SIT0_PRORE|nr:conjugal transfer protein TraN [Providencia rettgeri]
MGLWKDVTFNNGAVHEKLICDGAVQCLNGSCLRPSSQENGDFATAAAMLNAASLHWQILIVLMQKKQTTVNLL